MVQLKIYISGLCMLVPQEGQVTFLFPDASTEKKIQDELKHRKPVIDDLLRSRVTLRETANPGANLEELIAKEKAYFSSAPLKPHTMAVLFDVGNRMGSAPNYPFLQWQDRSFWGVWHLDGEDLSIQNAQGPLSINDAILKNPPGGNFLPEDGNKDDLGFVSPMWTSRKQLRKVKPEFLATPIQDPTRKVIARFSANHGALTNAAFSFDSHTNRFFIYEINGQTQAIATTVCLLVDVEGNEVVLQAKKFGDASPHRKLYLKPKEGQPIEIYLLNTELDELLGTSPAQSNQIQNRFLQEYLFLQRMLVMPNFKNATPIFNPNNQGGIVKPFASFNGVGGGGAVSVPGEVVAAGGNCSPAVGGG